MSKLIDLTGKTFGRWTVLYRDGTDKRGSVMWRCRCECGTEATVRGSSLTSGNSKSCGCYNHDSKVANATKHGQSQSRLYGIWEGMKSRCYDCNWHVYPYYGGRGITVCDEWRTSFQSFLEWANTHGYTDDLTIERVDVNGNYEPSNCIWIPKDQQMQNRRNVIKVQIGDETKSLSEWARIYGIPLSNVLSRVYCCHWDYVSAIITPVGKKGAHCRAKLPPAYVCKQPGDDRLDGVE